MRTAGSDNLAAMCHTSALMLACFHGVILPAPTGSAMLLQVHNITYHSRQNFLLEAKGFEEKKNKQNFLIGELLQ